jgi:hypothetical protein
MAVVPAGGVISLLLIRRTAYLRLLDVSLDPPERRPLT